MRRSMACLSQLLFGPSEEQGNELRKYLFELSKGEFSNFVELAHLNHVVVRALSALLDHEDQASSNNARVELARQALNAEHARIRTATRFLEEVCQSIEGHGHSVIVIKSLDHWPDLGSDLDLFTNSSPREICNFMTEHFHATLAPRSWGDKLACKWNFLIPGLPEAIEIHIGRLGQTGEQAAIASSLVERSRPVQIDGHAFRVASIADRIMISTLQRMYRHFFFRLCDVVDSAQIMEAGLVDYEALRRQATQAGIWEGVATYLKIVSDYVKIYRGTGLELPQFVKAAARFGGEKVFYRDSFLRVPIMPQSVELYGTQLAGVLKMGELENGARLSLLPWLASAALLGQKLTGSDKGIW
ncbi:MAG: nucleotidyltransferase family protein [Terracidiphilus sp.]